ncbi:MAG: PAS domain-containing protein [Proteobacteria bacterium]|nr:PAS domain-containing protein [Desulfobacteraceae bacterium]MBU3980461.1 PAS domain-containing protein [Pseudomonadota bacterium]MBU4014114.1 PAS domain-containing protein [Pseudomonadota bacterium]MBU4068949.1 PAS domain-containing protein [Pseudomonadota bacterium]MBU4100940.1 PAS domain-containing protein [Pseudomonadota bacterium]
MKIEDGMLENKEFLKAIIDGIRDQILVIDNQYRIEEVNEALLNRIGKQKKEIIGKYCYKVLHDDDKPCHILNHLCPVQEVLKTGKPCEVLHTHYEKQLSYYRVIAYPILDKNGVVTRVIEMARDITKWKKRGDQIYHTQKLIFLGKLTAGLAHELNNPLGVILGFSDLLLEKTDPGSKNHQILKTIERQGLNCKRIVEDLLNFARRPETDSYSVDVNASINRVLSVVEDILLREQIVIVRNFDEEIPNARGDSGRLQQVFIHIITNAVLSMQEGGRLTVCTRLDNSGHNVEVIFNSTGDEISKEYRDKIFGPFSTTIDDGAGIGIGLSASHDIVADYDGDISFKTVTDEEDKDRKGSTFTVVLPAVSLEK